MCGLLETENDSMQASIVSGLSRLALLIPELSTKIRGVLSRFLQRHILIP